MIHSCQPLEGGAFSREFTTNLAPQCRALSRALKIEERESVYVCVRERLIDR